MSTSSTNIHEVARGIFRINTPVDIAGGFSFNQYLVLDDAPLLFHTGPKKLFPVVSEALAKLMPLARLRYIAFSHYEADECGALNDWLARAPDSVPVCSRIAAMVSVNDVSDRPARAMTDGEILELGSRGMKWLDAPHLPHGWETGYMMDAQTGTLMCGDLFTQPGHGVAPVTSDDILAPSEAFRHALDYFSHSTNTVQLIDKLARENPSTLACMHGSAWQGDGASLLRLLGASLIQ
jgi:flavorubredoxin